MRALVAEDDLYTREALVAILEEEGYQVTACADGRNAELQFKEGTYDLVCLDVMMPGRSGYDVCRYIRKVDTQVPVLFISAKSEEIDKVLGLELGADDFIVKPFGVREVLARIHAIARRQKRSLSQEPPSQEFSFGPWTIVPGELRAIRGETRVDLLPRELAMITLLAEKPGQVVGRGTFFRVCWDLNNPPQSRTLDQHMVGLRKKLEDDPRNPRLIKTVQGSGYRYEW